MKKRLTLALFFFAQIVVFAQKQPAPDTAYVSTDVENEIYTLDFESAQKQLDQFLTTESVKVLSKNESKGHIKLKLMLTDAQYVRYEQMIVGLGNRSLNQLTTTNNADKVAELKLELAYLRKKNGSYSDLLKQSDIKSSNYLALWNEQKLIEEKIFNKERESIAFDKHENSYIVTLTVRDEPTVPESSKVAFVNMPGFEYACLFVESPKAGISAAQYQGYFLKYLFTKGKSFASIGVYKNAKQLALSDSTTYSELFLVGFGQDFYSRHLGRGSKRFFNLYSGYTVGGLFASGKSSNAETIYLAPSVGLELFKSKSILLDTKVNYFIPFTNSANLRGLSFNASFNFVF